MLARIFLCLATVPALAGTVVITTLPDETHPLDPLTTLAGVPLATATVVQVGAFPGSGDDALLDTAATGGLAAVTAAFAPFGDARTIGEGTGGQPGRFEIAVRQPLSASPLVGEEVSLFIQADNGQFLVARFKGQRFEADPDTGLEPLLSLHLADAVVVVGNRYGSNKIAASSAPESGSFASWIGSFPAIVDPELRLPGADADNDGRTNFVEWATGGNPVSPADPAPCQMIADETGGLWVRFSRNAGIGTVRHLVETSAGLGGPWQEFDGTPEPDPEPPVPGSVHWMRLRVPEPAGKSAFFRLNPLPAAD